MTINKLTADALVDGTLDSDAIGPASVTHQKLHSNIISGQTAIGAVDSSNDLLLIYDNDATGLKKVPVSSVGATNTDGISEGSSNLYYTNARADARAQLKIDALVDSAPGTLDTLNELAAALGDDANFSTTITNSIATKMPLSGGNFTGSVGIGTATPAKKLHIRDSVPDIRLEDTNTNAVAELRGNTGTGSFVIATDVNNAVANSKIIFEVDNSEAFRIQGNGIGIGTTSPGGLISVPATASNTPKFRLQSASTDTDFAISSYADANGTYVALGANHYLNSSGNDAVFETTDRSAFILLDARNAGAVTFGTNSSGIATERMRINSSGNVGIGTTNPATSYGRVLQIHDPSTSGTTGANLRLTDATSGAGTGNGLDIIQLGVDSYFINREAGDVNFYTNGQERFTIHADGHLGFGDSVMNDSPWSNVFGARSQWDTMGTIAATNGSMQIGHNWYYDAGGSTGYKYIAGGKANRQIHVNDYISWEMTNSTGSAGGEITFVEVMKLTADGKLGIGTTSPTQFLEVSAGAPTIGLHSPGQATNQKIVRIAASQFTGGDFSVQQMNDNGTGIHRTPFVINNAGNVGIGTTNADSLLHLQKTRTGLISSGTSDTGAVLKLHTEAQWESGYGNNPSTSTNDFLGSVEFSSGDSSTGEGVRAAIRATVDSYYNTNSLRFYTAPSYTAGITERLNIAANGNIGIGNSSDAKSPPSQIFIARNHSTYNDGDNNKRIDFMANGYTTRNETIRTFHYAYHPVFNQYSWHEIKLGDGSSATGHTIRYKVIWTTGHASGHGYEEGVCSVVSNHGSQNLPSGANNGQGQPHVRMAYQWRNGSYYGWSSTPNVRFYHSSASGTNAQIYMRVEGHGNHNGSTWDMACCHTIHVELYGSNLVRDRTCRWTGHNTPGDAGSSIGVLTLG